MLFDNIIILIAHTYTRSLSSQIPFRKRATSLSARPRTCFTNASSFTILKTFFVIQIPWDCYKNFAHATAAQLSWLVQNFVVISPWQFRWEQPNKIWIVDRMSFGLWSSVLFVYLSLASVRFGRTGLGTGRLFHAPTRTTSRILGTWNSLWHWWLYRDQGWLPLGPSQVFPAPHEFDTHLAKNRYAIPWHRIDEFRHSMWSFEWSCACTFRYLDYHVKGICSCVFSNFEFRLKGNLTHLPWRKRIIFWLCS